MARIGEAIGRCKSGAQDCVKAASLLGMSERHFRRLRGAYAEGGAETSVAPNPNSSFLPMLYPRVWRR